LELGDRKIVDELAVAQPPDLALESFDLPRPEAWRALDIDIKRIDEQPAARRIWASRRRTVIKQRVQRVETHARATHLGYDLKERRQIGEIAMAPVARRTRAIELDRENPRAPAVALKRRLRRNSGIGINRRLGLRFFQRRDHALEHLGPRLVAAALDI